MKMNTLFLLKQLSEFYSQLEYDGKYLPEKTERPVFLDEGQPAEKNKTYLIDARSGGADKMVKECDCLFFMAGRSENAHRERNTVSVWQESSIIRLHSRIQRIFDEYEEWYLQIIDEKTHLHQIGTMLDSSCHFLKHPLVVIGMDFSILASAGAEGTAMAHGVFGTTGETHLYLNELKQDAQYNAVRELDHWFFYNGIVENGSSVCVNLKKDGHTVYRLLMLASEEEEAAGCGPVLEVLAERLEQELLFGARNQQYRDNRLQAIFQSVLTDRTADYVKISQKLEALGWSSDDEYLAIVLQTSYLDQKNQTILSICEYIENIVTGSCAFSFKEDIVVFVNLQIFGEKITDLKSRLGIYIRDSLLKGGYSRIMVGHFNLRRQYLQARQALEVGSEKFPSQWIYHFNDISFEYLLKSSTKKLPGYMTGHEKLLDIQRMDERQGTEYYETLRKYLDNHLNAVQAARELYIHRSTFLYRLDRIREMLGSDLKDADEILYLMLTYRLLDREKNYSSRKHPV